MEIYSQMDIVSFDHCQKHLLKDSNSGSDKSVGAFDQVKNWPSHQLFMNSVVKCVVFFISHNSKPLSCTWASIHELVQLQPIHSILQFLKELFKFCTVYSLVQVEV